MQASRAVGVAATDGEDEGLAVRIAVCVKQVPDPDTPTSAFKVDGATNRVVPAPGTPPVVNGFDLNATEAALRVKDAALRPFDPDPVPRIPLPRNRVGTQDNAGGDDVRVTILAVGDSFVTDVIKKPLSMGADELVLVEDESLADLDAAATARVLSKAIRHQGPFDLILCGRQASDWDQAQVPLGIAEMLGLPCLTLARRVEVVDGTVRVERALTGGYQVVEAPLPAVVTVSNELGEARYPTLRGIMAATRKSPTKLSVSDLGLSADDLVPSLKLERLFVPELELSCELIEGDNDVDAGRRLALRLREESLI